MKPVTLNIDGLARSIARKVAIRFASNRLSLTAKEQKMADVRASYHWKRSTLCADVTASTMEELFNASRFGLLSSLQSRGLDKVDFDAIKAAYREARKEIERFHGASIHDEPTIEEIEWAEAQSFANSEAENERAKWLAKISGRFQRAKLAISAYWHASTSRKKAATLAADLSRIDRALALISGEGSLSDLMQGKRDHSAFWKLWKDIQNRILEGERLISSLR